MTVSAPPVGVPGLDVASTAGSGSAVVIDRMGANDWLAGLTAQTDADAVREAAGRQFEPVRALLQAPTTQAALTRVELDVCGAWVTLACVGTPQPVVVRRAGWIDFRGQLTPLPDGEQLADDRVGLGPGDCIVLLGPQLAAQVNHDGDAFAAECLPSALLEECGAASARQVLQGLQHALRSFNGSADTGPLLVLRVPLETKDQSAQRVAAATGLAIEELTTTRYPLGEQLMARRPAPPREARMQLHAELAEVSTVRELLKRLLASWRMAEAATNDVQLLASEVVGNAIRHSRSPVILIARYDGKRVRIEVGDGSPELPALKHPSAFDEGGRGMLLVESIARNWGVLATVGGKRVWFEVELGPEPRSALEAEVRRRRRGVSRALLEVGAGPVGTGLLEQAAVVRVQDVAVAVSLDGDASPAGAVLDRADQRDTGHPRRHLPQRLAQRRRRGALAQQVADDDEQLGVVVRAGSVDAVTQLLLELCGVRRQGVELVPGEATGASREQADLQRDDPLVDAAIL